MAWPLQSLTVVQVLCKLKVHNYVLLSTSFPRTNCTDLSWFRRFLSRGIVSNGVSGSPLLPARRYRPDLDPAAIKALQACVRLGR